MEKTWILRMIEVLMMNRSHHPVLAGTGIMLVLGMLLAPCMPCLAVPAIKTKDFKASQAFPRSATAPGSSDPTGDEWPMFRGQLNHTGVATTSAPVQGTGPTWSYTTTGLGGVMGSSPAIAGGRLYEGSEDHKVYCLNVTTGAFIWSYTTGGMIYASSPAVTEGHVYVGSWDHDVYCLNAITGAKIWNYTTGGGVDSSPAVTGGRVYVGSDDSKIYCLNATTGTPLWNYTTGGYVDSSPAVASGRLYVGSESNYMYCLNATTGILLWNYPMNLVRSSPALVGDRLYVGGYANSKFGMFCLNATTGTKIWNYTIGGRVDSSPAVTGGRVYVGCDNNNTYCLNATTGAYIWSYAARNQVDSSPAVTGGRVYVESWDCYVYCLSATTGSCEWHYTTYDMASLESSPAVAGGHLYVGGGVGVYCLPMIIIPVSITHPADITYIAGSTGNKISWTITATSTSTTGYSLLRNGSWISSGSWVPGTPISIAIDGLATGIYNYTIDAWDGIGSSVQDTIIVTVLGMTPFNSVAFIIIMFLGVAGMVTWSSRKKITI